MWSIASPMRGSISLSPAACGAQRLMSKRWSRITLPTQVIVLDTLDGGTRLLVILCAGALDMRRAGYFGHSFRRRDGAESLRQRAPRQRPASTWRLDVRKRNATASQAILFYERDEDEHPAADGRLRGTIPARRLSSKDPRRTLSRYAWSSDALRRA